MPEALFKEYCPSFLLSSVLLAGFIVCLKRIACLQVDEVHALISVIFVLVAICFLHDYLSPTLTPNLADLARQATLGHMESLYVTKTFPNHFSIATGLYEDEHEIINNKMYDPRLNKTFSASNIATEWWDYRGTNMPIWTANEVIAEEMGQRRYSGSMMFPGSSTPYRNRFPTHLTSYKRNANWTENVDVVISWLTDPERPANFVSMYFDEPDTVAHEHGPWGQQTLDAVRRVDSAAGYLVKRLREVDLASKTNILFVSDHGMAEVKKVVYMEDIIDTSNFKMHGSSPGWSIFIKPEKRHLTNRIFQVLLAVSKKNHFRIYKRADIPAEYHYSKSVRIGDFFILADEGYDLFPERPRDSKPLPSSWGNHGWKPSNRDMRPLFMAYGPSFRQDYNHEEVFPNIDLFPLMVFMLGLPSARLPNNGSLARIADVIDVGHFDGDESLKLAYVLFIGGVFVLLAIVVLIMLASSNRKRYKPEFDFDDLAPGLNIDLRYYLSGYKRLAPT